MLAELRGQMRDGAASHRLHFRRRGRFAECACHVRRCRRRRAACHPQSKARYRAPCLNSYPPLDAPFQPIRHAERWPSGRRRTPGKCVYGNPVSWVRIPPAPPPFKYLILNGFRPCIIRTVLRCSRYLSGLERTIPGRIRRHFGSISLPPIWPDRNSVAGRRRSTRWNERRRRSAAKNRNWAIALHTTFRSRRAGHPMPPCSSARDIRSDDAQLKVEVWRAGSLGGAAAQGARERERQDQAVAGRHEAGQHGVEVSSGKKVLTTAAIREAVAHLHACHGMSERRACRVIDADRKSMRYRSTRDDDTDLREKLRELANQRHRFGYRRLHILLRREDVMINRKKTQRLYKEEGLAVAPVLALPNQRWSIDFVHDQMASGRRFRVLNVVDDVTRECLAAVPDTSISCRRVVHSTPISPHHASTASLVSSVPLFLMPVSRSLPGWMTTTGRGRTHPLATQPRRRSPPNWISNGLLRYALRAPLRSPLLQPRLCAKQPSGSNPSWGKAGGHVSGHLYSSFQRAPTFQGRQNC